MSLEGLILFRRLSGYGKYPHPLLLRACRRRWSRSSISIPEPQWEEPRKDKEESSNKGGPWTRQYLKWTPVPFFALLAYNQYRRLEHKEPIKHWQITCYRMVPWRAISKAWGWFNAVQLPVWARGPFLSWYARTFECNIFEAEVEDLRQYRNLGEFFRRSLKEGLRPICQSSPMVSPVDGTVLQYGKVEAGLIEQVKGITYTLPGFLGPQTWNGKVDCGGDYGASLLEKPEQNCLYHCVIYLAPGDYHRFHSPAQWKVSFRRHFAGELLSVRPSVARWISGLFSLNERAAYVGKWEHGFFSMTAVGATNVGSIKVYKDENLATNCWSLKKNAFIDREFENSWEVCKGEQFGEFNLGSTMVIIFEAPRNFQFCCTPGSRIRMGEALFQPQSSS